MAQWLVQRTRVKRCRVRVPAGVAGKVSSPGSTFCADSYYGICSTPVLPQQHDRKKTEKKTKKERDDGDDDDDDDDCFYKR